MELPFERINDEVFVASADIVRLGAQAVDFLRQQATKNARGRARICTHKNLDDRIHEMWIAITAESYVRPHRHAHKSESFHLIDGQADIIIFRDDGEIEQLIEFGPKHHFYYRLDTPRYHTLIVHSAVLVIHEVTNGPFDRNASDQAVFSPAAGDPAAAAFMENLKLRARAWKESHGLR